MAKLYTYIFIIIGLMVLFNMAGLNTVSGVILNKLGIVEGNISDVQSSTLYYILLAAMAALVTAGVIMGIFGRGSPEIFVTAGLAVPLVAFVGDLVSITITASGEGTWVGAVVFLIMAPLIGAYIFALYDWVRGRD